MSPFSFENPLGNIREKVNKVMNESRLPNDRYQSTVGVYGGRMRRTEDNRLIYDMGGLVSKIDQAGDIFLRNYDEHVIKEPWKLLRRHPEMFFKFFMPGPKRYRGRPAEIMENVRDLGLEEYYVQHEKGIEVLQPEIFEQGIALQDIYRSDLIGDEQLAQIDRFEALQKAGEYLAAVHQRAGVGEVLVSDIIFLPKGEDKLDKAVLNIPDIVYNQEKQVGEKEKRATDLLDLLVSVGMEEARRSANEDGESNEAETEHALQSLLKEYNDYDVLVLTESFIKRGRLMLAGDKKNEELDYPEGSFTKDNSYLFSQHNVARMGNRNQNLDVLIKKLALQAVRAKCETLKNQK